MAIRPGGARATQACHGGCAWALIALVLAACTPQQGDQAGAQRGGPPPRPEVGVVTLRAQPVAITAELPGRTAASQVAEVRPQVTGIVRARLFEEGREVRAGDPLYEIEAAPYRAALDAAQASLQRAEATVGSAQSRFERQQELVRGAIASRQAAEDAAAALAQAQADREAARANVEAARINLANATIRSPIDGRADRSTLTPGALVSANQAAALTTVRTLDPMNVDLTGSTAALLNWRRAVSEGRLTPNGERSKVRLKLENGFPYPHEGTFAFAEANVSEDTGTFAVRVQFPNPDRLLWPGMYVRATIEEGVSPDSFLVPQRAVTRDAQGEAIALIVGADGKAQARRLAVSRSIGNDWLVTSGVADGDRVIAEGGQNVRPGQEVTANEISIDPATGAVRRPPPATARGRASQARN